MLFNSAQFLVFFPICVFVYFLLPQKIRTLWLLLCSYYFYMCWNPLYVLLLLFSTCSTWLAGFFVEAAKKKAVRKLALTASIVLNLGILFFFKYYGFFAENLSMALQAAGISWQPPAFDLLLPVGISFYTFQALGYAVDVYRGTISHERNFIRYALFVSFFPQLVAGPIERAKNLLPQFRRTHSFQYVRAKEGLLGMLWGMFKKIVIADSLGIMVTRIYEDVGTYAGPSFVLATLLFTYQLYCDFSGYSDIAIGAARVLGFDLMQNFRRPFSAFSYADFWTRWHISLSGWFRDYFYIPLGGNRKGRLRTLCNTFLTFLVSGLWHGANWTFAAWGGLNGIYVIISKLRNGYHKKKKKNRRFLQRPGIPAYLGRLCIMLLLYASTNVFFRANSIQDALYIYQHLFTGWEVLLHPSQALDVVRLITGGLSGALTMLGMLSILEIVQYQEEKRDKPAFACFARLQKGRCAAVCYMLLACLLFFGVYTASQFIYFQF